MATQLRTFMLAVLAAMSWVSFGVMSTRDTADELVLFLVFYIGAVSAVAMVVGDE